MARTLAFTALAGLLGAGAAGFALFLPLPSPLVPSAVPAAAAADAAPAEPEEGDPFSVETLPAQVAVTVGEPLVLPPPRVRGGAPPFARSLTGGPAARLVALDALRIAPASPGGSGPYTLTVTDARGRTASTQTHVVAALPLSMRGAPRDVATVGRPYEARFAVAGGRAPYAWSFSGLSPAGLAFVNGVLSGTPTQSGDSRGMVVTATDADGRQAFSGEFSVDVSEPLALQALPALVRAVAGEAVTLPAPAVSGGTGPYEVTLSGPPGAVLAADGSLSLQPGSAGRLGPYVLTARDARGRTASTSVTLDAVEPLKVSTYGDVVLARGIEARVPGPRVSGGRGPYAFSLASATGSALAPAGLAISRRTGDVAGIPSKAGPNGPYRIRVSDADGRTADSLDFSLAVEEAEAATAETSREVYVNGRRFCVSRRGDDCVRQGGFDVVEVRFPSLRLVDTLAFGCEFSSVPSGIWEISDGRAWTTVSPTSPGPCAAGIPATAVRAVRYTRVDGSFGRMSAPRATLGR